MKTLFQVLLFGFHSFTYFSVVQADEIALNGYGGIKRRRVIILPNVPGSSY